MWMGRRGRGSEGRARTGEGLAVGLEALVCEDVGSGRTGRSPPTCECPRRIIHIWCYPLDLLTVRGAFVLLVSEAYTSDGTAGVVESSMHEKGTVRVCCSPFAEGSIAYASRSDRVHRGGATHSAGTHAHMVISLTVLQPGPIAASPERPVASRPPPVTTASTPPLGPKGPSPPT